MDTRPCTDQELKSLPHIVLTSKEDWDPSVVHSEPFVDNTPILVQVDKDNPVLCGQLDASPLDDLAYELSPFIQDLYSGDGDTVLDTGEEMITFSFHGSDMDEEEIIFYQGRILEDTEVVSPEYVHPPCDDFLTPSDNCSGKGEFINGLEEVVHTTTILQRSPSSEGEGILAAPKVGSEVSDLKSHDSSPPLCIQSGSMSLSLKSFERIMKKFKRAVYFLKEFKYFCCGFPKILINVARNTPTACGEVVYGRFYIGYDVL
jgi:hypothetical protein